jgi:TATA-box binding protein (TBP) (component of TFIID and TFIIIB)
MEIPKTAPDLPLPKLVTMTTLASLDMNVNLNVVAHYLDLDDEIVGVHYEYQSIHKGVESGKKKKKRSDDSVIDEACDLSESRPFKNQCTIIVNVGVKNVNTKLFNNTKIINTGCSQLEHCTIVGRILARKITGLSGLVSYKIPEAVRTVKRVKFFKEELCKKNGKLICSLVKDLGMEMDVRPFRCGAEGELSIEEGYALFGQLISADPVYGYNVMYLFTLIGILNCYCDSNLSLYDCYKQQHYQNMLQLLINSTNHEQRLISCVLPAYIDIGTTLTFDEGTVKCELLNMCTNCGYYINRNRLHTLMENHELTEGCSYKKQSYPGVKIFVKASDGKIIKVIAFNTGKINITACKTYQHVEEAYQFISHVCKTYFDELLMITEYHNRQQEYNDSLPNQHYVGKVNGEDYYLLKKSTIAANPRNARHLSDLKLLDIY